MLAPTNPEASEFDADCDKCGTREGPIAGPRELAASELARRAWRLDERFTTATVCPKCAGPPSVFPAAHVTADPRRCSACNAEVQRCDACQADLREKDPISCRRSRGHAHARCSTQRMRRFEG